MADLKERIKVWIDYIKEHHNEYIKESLEGVDDEDVEAVTRGHVIDLVLHRAGVGVYEDLEHAD